jgi:hypothetical protein
VSVSPIPMSGSLTAWRARQPQRESRNGTTELANIA